MFAVIFELEPNRGLAEEYFAKASELNDELKTIAGFLSIERFESVKSPGRYLSLSFFENELALKTWREHKSHRVAQAVGRSRLFKDYRLRVAKVVRDYGLTDRAQALAD